MLIEYVYTYIYIYILLDDGVSKYNVGTRKGWFPATHPQNGFPQKRQTHQICKESLGFAMAPSSKCSNLSVRLRPGSAAENTDLSRVERGAFG